MSEALAPPGAPRDAWLSAAPPDDPLPHLAAWLDEARRSGHVANADAAALATVDAGGRPSVRMVLCRALDVRSGYAGFYTNLGSRKSEALGARPHAALVLHWDALGRQARIEGPVTLAPADDADAYFASRPRESQLAAWASAQGQPIASRAALLGRFAAAAARFGPDAADPPVPRPPNWGGWRVWIERVELWVSRPHRLHDRVLWERTLEPAGDGFRGGPWRATRLQP